MSRESWDSRLDRFAACLAAQREALAEGRPDDIRPFSPGPTTEPFPLRLAARGQQLQSEAAALEQDVAQALSGVARQLQLLAALNRDSDEPRARLLDCSA